MIEMLLVISSGILGIIFGRRLLASWFNHLSIYSVIWMGMLFLYELQLIEYNRITPQAWFLMILAWFMLFLGSSTVTFAKNPVKKRYLDLGRTDRHLNIYVKEIKTVIIVLSMLGSIPIVFNWRILLEEFGNVKEILLHGGLIYQLRLAYELPRLPYLGVLILVSAGFAGIYSAKCRRITFLGLLPLILQFILSLGSMARASFILACLLWVTNFFLILPPKNILKNIDIRKNILIIGILIFLLLFIGVGSIRSFRGARDYSSYGQSKIFSVLQEYIPYISPSLYFYLSGHPVVFSEYLKTDDEKKFFGQHTFITFYNFLSRFGLYEHYSGYQEFQYIPMRMNTGTYLREIHADFGILGIVLFPYLLGVACTVIYLKIKEHPNISYTILLSYLYLIIEMSCFMNIMRFGSVIIGVFVSVFIGVIIEYSGNKIIKKNIRRKC